MNELLILFLCKLSHKQSIEFCFLVGWLAAHGTYFFIILKWLQNTNKLLEKPSRNTCICEPLQFSMLVILVFCSTVSRALMNHTNQPNELDHLCSLLGHD
ncbi:hypothetical protein R3W88_023116 [Solanum pinnatisectum]|uniref:Uncharacterized protein n=1 Tax=Solanum pinnatisectum TaxID=50273 RepID=A0AAV9LXB2_9SOLN|nr:hypothetical protein R3W88_023116 [Solanum pinnatisectum]